MIYTCLETEHKYVMFYILNRNIKNQQPLFSLFFSVGSHKHTLGRKTDTHTHTQGSHTHTQRHLPHSVLPHTGPQLCIFSTASTRSAGPGLTGAVKKQSASKVVYLKPVHTVCMQESLPAGDLPGSNSQEHSLRGLLQCFQEIYIYIYCIYILFLNQI